MTNLSVSLVVGLVLLCHPSLQRRGEGRMMTMIGVTVDCNK